MQNTISNEQTATLPYLSVATSESATATVNRWLHKEIGFALHADGANFNPATFCWHVPIHLAFGVTGSLGVIGDVYLHAATGEFIGAPSRDELRQCADALADAHGITE